MFEFATAIIGGTLMSVYDDKDGGAMLKVRVERVTLHGKPNMSIFLLKCSKASWAYYQRVAKAGATYHIVVDLFRSEFKDEKTGKYGERMFGRVISMIEVHDVPPLPREHSDRGDAPVRVESAPAHKFSFEDAIPPNDTNYVPF